MKTIFTLLALLLTTTAFAGQSAINYGNDGVTATVKVVAWSGYIDSISGGCARTSTTLGDPSACTGIALTQRQNNGFGTVSLTSGGLPSLDITPDHAGLYLACADIGVTASASAGIGAQLIDSNSQVIGTSGGFIIPSSVNFARMQVCGLWNITSTSTISIKVQTRASTGTITINGGTSTLPGIEWTIYAIGNDAGRGSSWVGSLTWAPVTNCRWAVTTGTFGTDFSADTDCNAPTVLGDVTAPATKIPAITLNVEAGKLYRFRANGLIYSASRECASRMTDGTDVSSTAGSATTGSTGEVTMDLIPTSSGSKTYKFQRAGMATSETCEIIVDNTNRTFSIDVTEIPQR